MKLNVHVNFYGLKKQIIFFCKIYESSKWLLCSGFCQYIKSLNVWKPIIWQEDFYHSYFTKCQILLNLVDKKGIVWYNLKKKCSFISKNYLKFNPAKMRSWHAVKTLTKQKKRGVMLTLKVIIYKFGLLPNNFET